MVEFGLHHFVCSTRFELARSSSISRNSHSLRGLESVSSRTNRLPHSVFVCQHRQVWVELRLVDSCQLSCLDRKRCVQLYFSLCKMSLSRFGSFEIADPVGVVFQRSRKKCRSSIQAIDLERSVPSPTVDIRHRDRQLAELKQNPDNELGRAYVVSKTWCQAGTVPNARRLPDRCDAYRPKFKTVQT